MIPETVISNKFYSIWSTKINQEAFQIQCKYNIQNNSQYILGVVLIYKAKAEKFHQNSSTKGTIQNKKGQYVLHSCNETCPGFQRTTYIYKVTNIFAKKV